MKDFYALTERGRACRLRKLVDRALESYDLDITSVRLLSNDMNGVFRLNVADGRKYVMRVTGNLARYAYLYDGPEALPRLELGLPRGRRAPADAY